MTFNHAIIIRRCGCALLTLLWLLTFLLTCDSMTLEGQAAESDPAEQILAVSMEEKDAYPILQNGDDITLPSRTHRMDGWLRNGAFFLEGWEGRIWSYRFDAF